MGNDDHSNDAHEKCREKCRSNVVNCTRFLIQAQAAPGSSKAPFSYDERVGLQPDDAGHLGQNSSAQRGPRRRFAN